MRENRVQLYGEDGNDTIDGRGGDDYIDGGDSFINKFSTESLFGGTGNDTIYGGSGNEFIDGGDGNDYINTGTTASDRDSINETLGVEAMATMFDRQSALLAALSFLAMPAMITSPASHSAVDQGMIY